jgi:hypothetical protein
MLPTPQPVIAKSSAPSAFAGTTPRKEQRSRCGVCVRAGSAEVSNSRPRDFDCRKALRFSAIIPRCATPGPMTISGTRAGSASPLLITSPGPEAKDHAAPTARYPGVATRRATFRPGGTDTT